MKFSFRCGSLPSVLDPLTTGFNTPGFGGSRADGRSPRKYQFCYSFVKGSSVVLISLRDLPRRPRDQSQRWLGLRTHRCLQHIAVLSVDGRSKLPAALVGEAVLRRDPTLQCKASVISQIMAVGPEPKQVKLVDRQMIAENAGFHWKVLAKWYAVKQDIFQQIAKLKLGKYGPRPFGSNERLTGKSKAQCRLRREEATENYQSDVIKQLKNFVDLERSRGHTVTVVMLKDHYLKYLTRFAVKYRLMSHTEKSQKR